MSQATCAACEPILIVDDDPVTRAMLGRVLQKQGHGFTAASSGEEALDVVREAQPDLILLDVSMPDLDGFEVCRQLKDSPRTREIPVIFLTANADPEDTIKGINLGAVDYVTKPFHAAELMARVNTHLDLKRSKDKLDKLNEQLKRDIARREKAESALRENEEYLRTIMATIQAGVLVTDSVSLEIVDANPYALQLIGCRPEELSGCTWDRHLACEERGGSGETDWFLYNVHDEKIPVRRSGSNVRIHERDYFVQSFLDITDFKRLLQKQEVNISQAMRILSLVNAGLPRYTEFSEEAALVIDDLSMPFYAAGGDHYLVRNVQAAKKGERGKTLVSLKDQSGHEVGCVLRSIITDLMHNALITQNPELELEDITSRLNDEIFASGLFEEDDFFTSMNLEIDHETLQMRYVSCGHPAMLLIRKGRVTCLPDGKEGARNLPVGATSGEMHTAGMFKLMKGDKLILYTDGLTEMPMVKEGGKVSLDGLKELVEGLIKYNHKKPVSDLAREIVASISHTSGVEVAPPGTNRSGDDVTVLGIEIEDLCAGSEKVLHVADVKELVAEAKALSLELSDEWRKRGGKDENNSIRTVVEEAVLNAWKHGNRMDPEKSITVRWRYGNDLHFEVIDEGNGFDPAAVADPACSKNLLDESGRGIFMIRWASDHVVWTDGGRRIHAYLRKHPDEDGLSMTKKAGKLLELWRAAGWNKE